MTELYGRAMVSATRELPWPVRLSLGEYAILVTN